MKKLFLVVLAALGMTVAASAANYTINDSEIDALVENAVEMSSDSMLSEALASAPAASLPAASFSSAKSDVAALVLCFLLGEIAIHRHYMGTASFMWAAYLFTAFGIFGIVPFIDLIVIIVKMCDGSGIGQYCGSKKYFMWA